jgi:hypothetical protein
MPTTWTLTPGPFTQLLELLDGAGVSATMNPGEVNTPGCWLALNQLQPVNVRGTTRHTCSLYLIAPDNSDQLAVEALGELLATVTTVLTPDGPVRATRVVLPSGPTPLPALELPVYLYDEPAP